MVELFFASSSYWKVYFCFYINRIWNDDYYFYESYLSISFSIALAVNDVLIESLVYVLFVLLVVDFIHEAKYMIKNKHINKIWKVDIKEKYIVNHDQVRYIH